MARERVAVKTIIEGVARKARAWDIITDFSRYPAIMQNVDEVKVLSRRENGGQSEWYVTVDGAPLFWVEQDFFNRAMFESRFESMSGDLDFIAGVWKIQDYLHRGIALSFDVEYELGIPVIEEVLGPVLKEKMQANIEYMMTAIRNEVAASPHDERRSVRREIQRYATVPINDAAVRIHVVNISTGGMMVTLGHASDDLDLVLRFDGIECPSRRFEEEYLAGHSRLMFGRQLSEPELNHVCACLADSPVRTNPRFHVGTRGIVESMGRTYRVDIDDVSSCGMRLSCEDDLDKIGDVCTIGGLAIGVRTVVRSERGGRFRMLFSQPLSESSLETLITRLQPAPKTGNATLSFIVCEPARALHRYESVGAEIR